uniref:Uncharacterized protein n=1 Tax=Roseihalotalea indica TaxID=2867963 RepID=A0AA49JG98_9BACT|nr:hypothetical protein K4G66_31045 [Tunicatimonas sp. TK19036]
MFRWIYPCFFVLAWFPVYTRAQTQTVVGMGTDQPNPNAVLELVAKDKNQGFLVPRLTSAQRQAANFINKLTDKDNGLLIFDTDEGSFYYWLNQAWQEGSSVNSLTQGTVWYVGETLPDNAQGEDQDFYIHQPSGDLYRKQDGAYVAIGNLNSTENPYTAGVGIRISDQNEIVNTGDLDSENELQDLSLNGTILGLSGSDKTVDLSDLQDNTDAQTLTLGGNNLSIANGNSVDLSPFADNTDNQSLSIAGSSLSISGGNTVNLSGVNTDSQTLNLSGNSLGISGGNSIDISSINSDSQNISSTKTANNVSLAITGGTGTTFSVADNDNDDTNETITSANLVTGDILRIQEAGTDHDVDLSSFQKKALPSGQVLVGNGAGVAAPVTFSGDITLASDGTMTIKLDAITTAKILNDAITTAKVADDAVTKAKINADVAGNGLGQNADGSIEAKVAGGGIQIAADQLQLTNQGNGQLLIGDGTQVNAQPVSGDISMANSGTTTVTGLQGRSIATAAPATNDVLMWNGSAWVPQSFASNGWYSGNFTPNGTTPTGAIDGNYFFHTGTQTVYRKESGAWVELGNWAKQSDSSVQGATITSTRTPVIYIGTGDPIDNAGGNNGEPGDFYYETDADTHGRLWMKKNRREWITF